MLWAFCGLVIVNVRGLNKKRHLEATSEQSSGSLIVLKSQINSLSVQTQRSHHRIHEHFSELANINFQSLE